MDVEQLIAEKPLLHTDENGNPVDYSINISVVRALNSYLRPGMNTLETGSGPAEALPPASTGTTL